MTPLRSTGDHQQRFFTRPRLCQSLPLRRILAATCLGCARDCHVYTVLYYIIVYYILYYIISYHIILYHIILYLYYNFLYYIIYHIILYYMYTIMFILYYISYHIIYIVFHSFHFGSKPSTHIQKHLNLRKRRFVLSHHCIYVPSLLLHAIDVSGATECFYILLRASVPWNLTSGKPKH